MRWAAWMALGALGAVAAAAPALAAEARPPFVTPEPVAAERAAVELRAESRLRYDLSDRGAAQGQFRGIVGLAVRATPHVRAYGELGTARSEGRPGAGANFQNDVALQQLFLDLRGHVGSTLAGGLIGRQEFASGPRQLVSVADGPNLHRTWNGVRLYAQEGAVRVGAFDLRGTRLAHGAFDDGVDDGERLQGLDASLAWGPGRGGRLVLDPFWFHTENPAFGAGGGTGRDDRESFGLRLRGTSEALSFDWVLARQLGRSLGRDVDAIGLFAVQSVSLSDQGWKPRVGARLDLASGGADGRAGFNQLYASSSYVSEGLFLSTSNLLLVAPSLALAPTPATTLSLEYALARRLLEGDAAYAGLMRAYAGTERVPGHALGGLLRVGGSWAVTDGLALGFAYEHLAAGEVLRRAGVPSGHYGYVRSTVRY